MRSPDRGIAEAYVIGDNLTVVDLDGDVVPPDDYMDELDYGEATDAEEQYSYSRMATSYQVGAVAVSATREAPTSTLMSVNMYDRPGYSAKQQLADLQKRRAMPLLHQFSNAAQLPEYRARFDTNAQLGLRSPESGRANGGYYGNSRALPPHREYDLRNQFDLIAYRRVLCDELRVREAEMAEIEASDEYKRQQHDYDLEDSRHNDNSPIAVEPPALVERVYDLFLVVRQLQTEIERIKKFDRQTS